MSRGNSFHFSSPTGEKEDGIKTCTKCKQSFPFNFFNKQSNGKFGLRGMCKNCVKQYTFENRERFNLREKEYRKQNSDKISLRKKEYYKKNKEKIKQIHLIYSKNNKEKIAQKKLKTEKERIKTDINFRLVKLLRSRIKSAIKKNLKAGSAVKDIGCSIEYLKKYLENKFYINKKTGEQMTWENWGLYGWHLDHIIPLSSFNLSNREEFLEACHYTNLQPLWAEENLSKSNKIIKGTHMSRGGLNKDKPGQIPEDQVDKVKIKQLENRIQELEGRLFRIRKLIEEIYPMFKLIQAPEDNMVQWLIRS